jgi:hypothetical protein
MLDLKEKRTMRSAVFAVAAMVFAAGAQADAILSFGFTDLEGSFNAGTSTFSAMGVNTAPLHTAGSVNRLQDPVANAQYNAGTAAGLVNFSLTVGNIMPASATGTGSITIIDADGDSFTSDVTGTFSLVSGAVFFNGLMPNPAFVPGPQTNNMFDGPSGGSFPLTFAPAQPPFTGAVVQLFFDPGTFFSQSYSGIATQLNGSVIPTPATLGLLTAGLAMIGRRRR